MLASLSLNSRVVRCQGTEKSLKASPKIRSYCFLSWLLLDELAGVAPGGLDRRVAREAERLVVGLGDRRVDLGDVDGVPGYVCCT